MLFFLKSFILFQERPTRLKFLYKTRRFLSSLVLFTFLFSLIQVSDLKNANAATIVPQSPLFVFDFDLPRNLGELTHISPKVLLDPTSDEPLFFHIQSSHRHYETETNIKEILRFLTKEYDIKHIFLEGGAYRLHPENFQFFPEDPEMNKKVVQTLLQKGELTGAEAFLIESEQNVSGWGLEDAKLYKENRDLFKKIIKLQPQAQTYLDFLILELNSINSVVLNNTLKKWLQQKKRHKEQTTPLSERLRYLKKQAKKQLDLDLSTPISQNLFPTLVRYFQLEKSLKEFNLEHWKKEKDLFLHELKKMELEPNLAKEIHSFLDKTPGFLKENYGYDSKTSQIFSLPKLRFVFERLYDALPEDFDIKRFPSVAQYIQIEILKDEVKGKQMFQEIKILEEKVLSSLIQTPEEKEHINLLEEITRLKKLIRLELTREEYNRYFDNSSQQNKPEHILDSTHQTISQTIKNKKTSLDILKQKLLETGIFDLTLSFYRAAIDREEAMTNKLLKHAKEVLKEKTIFITGGFHSEIFESTLKKNNLNYVQISPHMGDGSDFSEETYLKASLGKSFIETAHKEAPLRTDPLLLSELNDPMFLADIKAVVDETVLEVSGKSLGGLYDKDKTKTVGEVSFTGDVEKDFHQITEWFQTIFSNQEDVDLFLKQNYIVYGKRGEGWILRIEKNSDHTLSFDFEGVLMGGLNTPTLAKYQFVFDYQESSVQLFVYANWLLDLPYISDDQLILKKKIYFNSEELSSLKFENNKFYIEVPEKVRQQLWNLEILERFEKEGVASEHLQLVSEAQGIVLPKSGDVMPSMASSLGKAKSVDPEELAQRILTSKRFIIRKGAIDRLTGIASQMVFNLPEGKEAETQRRAFDILARLSVPQEEGEEVLPTEVYELLHLALAHIALQRTLPYSTEALEQLKNNLLSSNISEERFFKSVTNAFWNIIYLDARKEHGYRKDFILEVLSFIESTILSKSPQLRSLVYPLLFEFLKRLAYEVGNQTKSSEHFGVVTAPILNKIFDIYKHVFSTPNFEKKVYKDAVIHSFLHIYWGVKGDYSPLPLMQRRIDDFQPVVNFIQDAWNESREEERRNGIKDLYDNFVQYQDEGSASSLGNAHRPPFSFKNGIFRLNWNYPGKADVYPWAPKERGSFAEALNYWYGRAIFFTVDEREPLHYEEAITERLSSAVGDFEKIYRGLAAYPQLRLSNVLIQRNLDKPTAEVVEMIKPLIFDAAKAFGEAPESRAFRVDRKADHDSLMVLYHNAEQFVDTVTPFYRAHQSKASSLGLRPVEEKKVSTFDRFPTDKDYWDLFWKEAKLSSSSVNGDYPPSISGFLERFFSKLPNNFKSGLDLGTGNFHALRKAREHFDSRAMTPILIGTDFAQPGMSPPEGVVFRKVAGEHLSDLLIDDELDLQHIEAIFGVHSLLYMNVEGTLRQMNAVMPMGGQIGFVLHHAESTYVFSEKYYLEMLLLLERLDLFATLRQFIKDPRPKTLRVVYKKTKVLIDIILQKQEEDRAFSDSPTGKMIGELIGLSSYVTQQVLSDWLKNSSYAHKVPEFSTPFDMIYMMEFLSLDEMEGFREEGLDDYIYEVMSQYKKLKVELNQTHTEYLERIEGRFYGRKKKAALLKEAAIYGMQHKDELMDLFKRNGFEVEVEELHDTQSNGRSLLGWGVTGTKISEAMEKKPVLKRVNSEMPKLDFDEIKMKIPDFNDDFFESVQNQLEQLELLERIGFLKAAYAILQDPSNLWAQNTLNHAVYILDLYAHFISGMKKFIGDYAFFNPSTILSLYYQTLKGLETRLLPGELLDHILWIQSQIRMNQIEKVLLRRILELRPEEKVRRPGKIVQRALSELGYELTLFGQTSFSKDNTYWEIEIEKTTAASLGRLRSMTTHRVFSKEEKELKTNEIVPAASLGQVRNQKSVLIDRIRAGYEKLKEEEKVEIGDISLLVDKKEGRFYKTFPHPGGKNKGSREPVRLGANIEELELRLLREEEAIVLEFIYTKKGKKGVAKLYWTGKKYETEYERKVREMREAFKNLEEEKVVAVGDVSLLVNKSQGKLQHGFPTPNGNTLNKLQPIGTGMKGARQETVASSLGVQLNKEMLIMKIREGFRDLEVGNTKMVSIGDVSLLVDKKRGRFYQTFPTPDGGTVERGQGIGAGKGIKDIYLKMIKEEQEIVLEFWFKKGNSETEDRVKFYWNGKEYKQEKDRKKKELIKRIKKGFKKAKKGQSTEIGDVSLLVNKKYGRLQSVFPMPNGEKVAGIGLSFGAKLNLKKISLKIQNEEGQIVLKFLYRVKGKKEQETAKLYWNGKKYETEEKKKSSNKEQKELIKKIRKGFKDLESGKSEAIEVGDVSLLIKKKRGLFKGSFPTPNGGKVGASQALGTSGNLSEIFLTIRKEGNQIVLEFRYTKMISNTGDRKEKIVGKERLYWNGTKYLNKFNTGERKKREERLIKQIRNGFKSLKLGRKQEVEIEDISLLIYKKYGTLKPIFPTPDGGQVRKGYPFGGTKHIKEIALRIKKEEGQIVLEFFYKIEGEEKKSVRKVYWHEGKYESEVGRKKREIHEGFKNLQSGEKEKIEIEDISLLVNMRHGVFKPDFPTPDGGRIGKSRGMGVGKNLKAISLRASKVKGKIVLEYFYKTKGSKKEKFAKVYWFEGKYEVEIDRKRREIREGFQKLQLGEQEEIEIGDVSLLVNKRYGNFQMTFPTPDGSQVGRVGAIGIGKNLKEVTLTIRKENGEIILVFFSKTKGSKKEKQTKLYWYEEKYESETDRKRREIREGFQKLQLGEQEEIEIGDVNLLVNKKAGNFKFRFPTPDGGQVGKQYAIGMGGDSIEIDLKIKREKETGKILLEFRYQKQGRATFEKVPVTLAWNPTTKTYEPYVPETQQDVYEFDLDTEGFSLGRQMLEVGSQKMPKAKGYELTAIEASSLGEQQALEEAWKAFQLQRPQLIAKIEAWKAGKRGEETARQLRDQIYKIERADLIAWDLDKYMHKKSSQKVFSGYKELLIALFSDLQLNPLGFQLDFVKKPLESIRFRFAQKVPSVMERYARVETLSEEEKDLLREEVYEIDSSRLKEWQLERVLHRKEVPLFDGDYRQVLILSLPDLKLNPLGFGLDFTTLEKALESMRFIFEKEILEILKRYEQLKGLSELKVEQLREEIYAIRGRHLTAWGLEGLGDRSAAPYFKGSTFNALNTFFSELNLNSLDYELDWSSPEQATASVHHVFNKEFPELMERYRRFEELSFSQQNRLRDEFYQFTQNQMQALNLRAATQEYFQNTHAIAMQAIFPKLELNVLGFSLDWSSPEQARASLRFVFQRHIPSIMERYEKIDQLDAEMIERLRRDIYHNISNAHFRLWKIQNLIRTKVLGENYLEVLDVFFNDPRLGFSILGMRQYRKQNTTTKYQWKDLQQAKTSIKEAMRENMPELVDQYEAWESLSLFEQNNLRDDFYAITAGHIAVWGLNSALNNRAVPFFKGKIFNVLNETFPNLKLNPLGFALDYTTTDRALESIRYVLSKKKPKVIEEYDRRHELSQDEIEALKEKIYQINSRSLLLWGLRGAFSKKESPQFEGSYVRALQTFFSGLELNPLRFRTDFTTEENAINSVLSKFERYKPQLFSKYQSIEDLTEEEVETLREQIYRIQPEQLKLWGLRGAFSYFKGGYRAILMAVFNHSRLNLEKESFKRKRKRRRISESGRIPTVGLNVQTDEESSASSLGEDMSDTEVWKYGFKTVKGSAEYNPELKKAIREFFRALKGSNPDKLKIISVDTGTGAYTAINEARNYLEEQGWLHRFELVGTDIFEPEEKAPKGVRFEKVATESLSDSFALESLDGVMSVRSLLYTDVKDSLFVLNQVLKVGGEGLFILHHKYSEILAFDRDFQEQVDILKGLKLFAHLETFVKQPNYRNLRQLLIVRKIISNAIHERKTRKDFPHILNREIGLLQKFQAAIDYSVYLVLRDGLKKKITTKEIDEVLSFLEVPTNMEEEFLPYFNDLMTLYIRQYSGFDVQTYEHSAHSFLKLIRKNLAIKKKRMDLLQYKAAVYGSEDEALLRKLWEESGFKIVSLEPLKENEQDIDYPLPESALKTYGWKVRVVKERTLSQRSEAIEAIKLPSDQLRNKDKSLVLSPETRAMLEIPYKEKRVSKKEIQKMLAQREFFKDARVFEYIERYFDNPSRERKHDLEIVLSRINNLVGLAFRTKGMDGEEDLLRVEDLMAVQRVLNQVFFGKGIKQKKNRKKWQALKGQLQMKYGIYQLILNHQTLSTPIHERLQGLLKKFDVISEIEVDEDREVLRIKAKIEREFVSSNAESLGRQAVVGFYDLNQQLGGGTRLGFDRVTYELTKGLLSPVLRLDRETYDEAYSSLFPEEILESFSLPKDKLDQMGLWGRVLAAGQEGPSRHVFDYRSLPKNIESLDALILYLLQHKKLTYTLLTIAPIEEVREFKLLLKKYISDKYQTSLGERFNLQGVHSEKELKASVHKLVSDNQKSALAFVSEDAEQSWVGFTRNNLLQVAGSKDASTQNASVIVAAQKLLEPLPTHLFWEVQKPEDLTTTFIWNELLIRFQADTMLRIAA